MSPGCAALLLLLLLAVTSSQGLKCRIEQDTQSQEEFEEIIRLCIRYEDEYEERQNQNNRKNGDNSKRGNNRPTGNRNDHSQFGRFTTEKYQEENDYDYEYENGNNSNRKGNNKNNNNNSNQKKTSYTQNKGYPNNLMQGNKQQDNWNQGFNSSRNTGSPLESIEPCIIHCIFRHKKMLSNDNYLDKMNTIYSLTHRVRDYELRNFIEDSINECFDILDNQRSDGRCEDSKNFALCLEEKGKNKCDDWDTNNRNNKNNNNNNYHNRNPNDRNNNYNPNQDNTYFINNNHGHHDRNNDKQHSLSTYGNREQEWQNNGSNQDKGGNNYQSNRDQNKNNNRNNNQYGQANLQNRGNSNQDDGSRDDKVNFSSYFSGRG